ncbi:secretion protein HlyD [Candidatus Koribacter versatilis Ellin345]|uniref:Secretion protein HlyD n=1 Tax=Koribacter versatilis (strain Ellin345) TaxID=204669 RepID=Q1IMT1_KORVE|nr:efflux RND transporter periplasmic adaptor subunit [Candidatus Koribacter versatilis]ABF41819.1 secretion protein HlyD [Candidatus Koribacter versatilis Ellin345]
MPKFPIISTALLAALGLAVLSACGRSAQGGAPQGFPAMHVQTQPALAQNVGDFTEYLATIKSRGSSILQPEVEGQITQIFVKSGQHVQPGQVLMEIDPRRQAATVSSQEANANSKRANLDWASKELERRKGLYAAGVISRQDLDQALTSYDAAKADLTAMDETVKQQKVQLHYFSVYAPTAGIVGDIPVRVGDRVTVATVLTTLDTGAGLEAYISVPAEKSADVKQGMPVTLATSDGKTVATTISFISPRVDPATQLLLVKANVPASSDFRNDQVIHARVIWKSVSRPTLPVTAVSRIGGATFAFVVGDNKGQAVAQQRSVQLGEIVGNSYTVLGGISPGDKVIVSSVNMLVDGMPIVPETASQNPAAPSAAGPQS